MKRPVKNHVVRPGAVPCTSVLSTCYQEVLHTSRSIGRAVFEGSRHRYIGGGAGGRHSTRLHVCVCVGGGGLAGADPGGGAWGAHAPLSSTEYR